MFNWLNLIVSNILKQKKIKNLLKSADIYRISSDYQKAISVLKEVLKESSDEPRASLGLARIYKERDDWDSAILEYKSAIEKFIYKNDYKYALQTYEELKQAYPKANLEAKLLFDIACAYERYKKYQQAYKVYKELINEYPFSELVDTALYSAADISFKKLQDINSAKTLFEALISKYPHSEWVNPAKEKLKLINSVLEEEDLQKFL